MCLSSQQLVLHCSAGFDNSPTAELKAAGIKALRVFGILILSLKYLQQFVSKLFAIKYVVITKRKNYTTGPLLLSGFHCRVCDRTDHGVGQKHPHELRHDQEGQL